MCAKASKSADLIRRPQHRLSPNSNVTSPLDQPASHTQAQHLPIISLSKLRDYMPQSQLATKLLISNRANNPSRFSQGASVACYGNEHNPSLYLRRSRDKLARANPLSLEPNFTGIHPVAHGASGSQCEYQTFIDHQESSRTQQQNKSTNFNASKSSSDSDKRNIEPKTAVSPIKDQQHCAESRRKGSDTSLTLGQGKRAESFQASTSSNNMTPSSLLLLHNHNYIEQRNPASYEDNNHDAHQLRSDPSVGQSSITIDSCGNNSARTARPNDDQLQSHITGSTLGSSSSSHMLTHSNHFKASDSALGCNPSICTSGNQIITPSANGASSSDYLANQDLDRIPDQLTHNLGAAATRGNMSLNYQQGGGLSVCDMKPSLDSSQYDHYGMNTNCRLSNDNYNQNYHTSVHDQQMKLSSEKTGRNTFDDSNNTSSEAGTIHHQGNANVDTAVRSLAQHQRSHLNSYYNAHYNLMPTASSKSSSPASSSTTPSPKTNVTMQQPISTSHQSSQLVANSVTNPQTSQIQLEQFNQHYMTNTMASCGMNQQQQQHQLNQHYAYSQQATGGTVQHHFAMPSHDQSYGSHQHQQQHQQQQQGPHGMHAQQSIYHHLANNAANVNAGHMYATPGGGSHYQSHVQNNVANQPQSHHLISGSHQNHLNSAAAACAAAAVVSQTLKTVANQQGQPHHYGSTIANGLGPAPGNLMNMTAQHNQPYHSMNSIGSHHLANQNTINQQHQTVASSVPSANSIVTRKYQCKMCPQVFMSKAEMKYHNQNHMREAKPYKCLQCPKAFANSSYLSQHMRIHQGVKPYTCDICARKFTQLSHLQQHKRTHTGDKPYKCNYMNCTKQFSQLSNLQSHSRCHQLDKPYKCNSCYKCFHDEQSLLEHIPRHLESKHLKKNLCIFCGSSYQQERGLVKHFQQYHTDKSPTLVAAAIAAGTTGNMSLIASIISSQTSNSLVSSGGGSVSSTTSNSSSSIGSGTSMGVHNHVNVCNAGPTSLNTGQY